LNWRFFCISLLNSRNIGVNHQAWTDMTFFFLWAVLGFNSWPYTCQAAALPLEPHLQPFHALVVFQVGSYLFAQS
jgi:cytosine/uracil/thiamine/allantoin permease